MSAEPLIGWDVGGAHLKAARLDAEGRVTVVCQVACPLWQGLEHLHRALETILSRLGPVRRHAITMTGEMVDLFPDRVVGVARLVATLEERLPGSELHFYAGADGFLPASAAAAASERIASANWLATAELMASAHDCAVLCDIGSTTTDLVPSRGGRVVARGQDDFARLIAGELVYTGVVRTPLMALAESVPFEGQRVPLVAEYFATTADVYRLLGQLPDDADLHPAADGGEKTPEGSARRLARMIGRDAASASASAWIELARWFADRQVDRIVAALTGLLDALPAGARGPIVAAGVGRFLVPQVAARLGLATIPFASLVPGVLPDPERLSDCAPAVSVARLLHGIVTSRDLIESSLYQDARARGLCHDGAMEAARNPLTRSRVGDGPPPA